ncbi:uncharacterized protein LOC107044927 [Diachasma alloeum]|uniref:uncharacterized protein LOC107044927 n=1 Tax=Diachasma alloeum TaxID=454923 RepID=UPI0010FAFE38|nr:uncharacterized protein LOC107044927 [Diachasma alloeum]
MRTAVPILLQMSVICLLRRAAQSLPVDPKIISSGATCPRIITRREWNARNVSGLEPLWTTPIPYVVVHHGGILHYCYDQPECSAIVRSYQDLHIDKNHWLDIGYHFVIGEDSNVYEGRGWDYVGAHAPGYNSQSIGVSVIGDFSHFLPNDGALKALDELIACGVALGKISPDYRVIGHRQVRDTVCPGETFYKYVMKMPRWTADPIPVCMSNCATNTSSHSADGLRHPSNDSHNVVTLVLMVSRNKITEGNPGVTQQINITRTKRVNIFVLALVSRSSSKMKVLVAIVSVNLALIAWTCPAAGSSEDDSSVSPTIVSRAQWGARAPNKTPEGLGINPPPFVVIHHSDSNGCTSQAICQARVRSFQNYHMDHNGWDDIGYNFLVGEDGNVYEGRGWGIRGAHSPNYNAKSLGICFIGNFESREPQPAAIKAAEDLLGFGVANGTIKSDYTLLGHRQTKSTTCPGDELYELIQTWPHWKRI